MKTLPSFLVIGMVTLGLAPRAAPIGISLQPSVTAINEGDSTSVDLVVSGLGNLAAPSLGAFDFDLSYDPAILAVVSLAFGGFLDVGVFGSIPSSNLSTPGFIHLDEISLEASSSLNGAQPDSFTLATLDFKGLTAGISSIGFSFASLSDELGQSLTGFSTAGASVQVNRSVSIPDSGSAFFLLLVGLSSLAGLRVAAAVR